MDNEKGNSFQGLNGDEIVISGISGAFPNSANVLDFGENLYNNVDMVSKEPRWKSNDPELPKHMGKISGIDKFDAQFFKVGYQQALVLEPISRKILEHAYGAIFDSGNSHVTLDGQTLGVFVGVSSVDFSSMRLVDIEHRSDFIVGGSSKAMLANRISYWANGKGPSFTIDYSCTSSAAALALAYNSIAKCECDCAIVGSGNLCLHPLLTLNMRRYNMLCMDGKTKCFDKNADGYVRSEAITLLFLQKAKNAKRIYAEVYHADGYFELKSPAPFLPVRKSEDIQKFLKDFYFKINVEPEEIEYVEANGAAITQTDDSELDAIGKVFANNKTVKIGCVKSNMGHSEAASGLTAVTKLCLAYHKGEIPANLHYKEPLDTPAVRDGKLQVVTERTKFNRGFTALNNFSFTGVNYHVVLKGHYKEKNTEKYKCHIPRIVYASSRDDSGVIKIFDALKSKSIDAEEVALLHDIFQKDIIGHTGRGYTILDTNNEGETVSVSQSVDYYSGVRRPLWFVFSGMGSQWTCMGADLMRIPTFARAIERCHKVLEPKGVDIVKIISSPDKTIFDNILNAFVGIGAVQIGLTDILREMGVEPDYIIGHSLGEMACAYHDNTFTTEELMLATYNRGSAILSSILVEGAMAAVGLGYKNLVKQCPPEIDIACHNSSESSTISGPTEAMKKFVGELTKQGIFAREVPSAKIAYHSRYIAGAGPELLRSLCEVIKHPKPRSKKWLSTSVPKERWDDEIAKYSSPEYHKNNMLSPVLFEEVINTMPHNAVVVEIAPHGLLQAILKRSHPDCTHIPLTRRECPDGVEFLLDAIGKLYQAGYNPKVDVLYPKVEYPVSTETPLLSHLVKWEHSETWPLIDINGVEKVLTSSRDLIISLHDDDYSYIADHVIEGITTIPEAALLLYVWETLAISMEVDYRELSIVFEDIHFHSEVIVHPETVLKLSIMINKGSDKFEMCCNDSLVVTGVVHSLNTEILHSVQIPDEDFDDIILNSGDIYKILEMRGYSYRSSLKTLHLININQNNAFIKWTTDWVPFLNSLIQLNIITRSHNGISKPRYISKLIVNTTEQDKSLSYPINFKEDSHSANLDTCLGITRCAGVEITGITFEDKPPVYRETDVFKERSFYPYFATSEIDMKISLDVNLQVIAENSVSQDINIIYCNIVNNSELFKEVKELAKSYLDVNITEFSNIDDDKFCVTKNATNVFILEDILGDEIKLKRLFDVTEENSFILIIEKKIPHKELPDNHVNVLTCMSDGQRIMLLLNKLKRTDASYFPITTDNKFLWVSRVSEEIVTTKRIVVVSENQIYDGALGIVSRLLKLHEIQNLALVSIEDYHAEPFEYKNVFYKVQLEKNMAINILKKGQWGGYYYTSASKCTKLYNFTLKNMISGDFNSLTWTEAARCSPQKTIVQVSFSSVSMLDCQKAINNFKSDNGLFGMDFSGIDNDGDRVMGLISGGSMSSTIEADSELLWPVPEHWSLEDAATVPLAFLQAYYIFALKRKLMKGHRVLVTGGVGALGQAVISLCLALDCTVYTTISDSGKMKFLLNLFPQLNENNICFSDPMNMHTMIQTNTKKNGCDFVINCAAGSLREMAMKCVGYMGIFIDFNKDDMFENKPMGMSYLDMEKNYISADFSNIFRPEFANDKTKLRQFLSEGIASGVVKPLTRVIFSPSMVTRAFKLLSMRKHRGRVLIRLRDPDIMSKGLKVSPRLTYKPEGVTIIICDEQGLAVALADRLVERGAKKIMLHSKPNLVSGYVHTKLISWSKHEVSVKLCSENLHIEQGCASLMKNAMKFGKVTGVFIVQDGNRDGNGDKDFINVYNRRCSVVMNLDIATRNCTGLSHFTIVSHLPQNASDEYALSLSERVCELRNEMGFPALVIRYESLAELNGCCKTSRTKSQTIATFLDSLETSLKMKYKNVLTFNLRENEQDFQGKIARILGVQDTQALENETTLLSLNLNEIALKELRAAIKNFYEIDYPPQKIQSMTIQSLKDLSNINKKNKSDFEGGMNTFYKEVIKEEDILTQRPVTAVPTLINHNFSNNETIDPHASHLIMIPGFDGRCEILKTAAERLKIQAIGVQLPPDMEGDSIPEIAKNIRKLIAKTFEVKSKFYILGYSFGVNIALELAALLEKEGHSGFIFCLDSSPDALKINLDAYLGKLTDEELQNIMVHHIYSLMSGKKNENLLTDLGKSSTYQDKVDITAKKLKEIVSYSEQYERNVLQSAYKRIKLAKDYRPCMKLKSDIILLKGIAHPNADLVRDYNLSQHTEKPIKIFELEFDHGLVHQDTRVSNIVNKFVETKILKKFNI